jgi:hypothetical protein
MTFLLYLGLVWFYVVYALIKWIAYSAWSFVGIKMLRVPSQAPLRNALQFGAARLMMGLLFGVAIHQISSLVSYALGLDDSDARHLWTYILVYIPVRWIEWSLLAAMMHPSKYPLRSCIWNLDSKLTLWRLGGMAVSCVADLPVIATFGFAPDLEVPKINRPNFHWPDFRLPGRWLC